MFAKAPRNLLACLMLFILAKLLSAQGLTFSQCASNCTLTASANCQDDVQCFCTDDKLYQDVFQCWRDNCTVHEALIAQNITTLTCGFSQHNDGFVGTTVTFTSMSIALVFVGLHIMAFLGGRPWGWDDVLIAFATILMIANAICNPISRHYGYGKDVWRLPFSDTTVVLEMFYIGGIIYCMAVGTTKMAFLFFYTRLFTTQGFRRVAYPLLALIGVLVITFTFLFTFQCSPVSYAWTSWDGEAQGTCLNFGIGAVIHAITNIALDFIIFALPLFRMRNLHVSRKKRWQVSLMFAVGFFVTLVSIIRLKSLVAIANSWNLTYDYIPIGYWSDLELNIGIACFCMPAARVILRKYFPNCGLGTTRDDSDEVPLSNNPHRRLGNVQIKSNPRSEAAPTPPPKNPFPVAKMPQSRVLSRDDSSDGVEVGVYETRPAWRLRK